MLADQISDIKRGLKFTAAIAGWELMAALAGSIALTGFVVALFIFLMNEYDAVTASLVLGGCFLLLAAIFTGLIFYVRQQRERKAKAAALKAANSGAAVWLEPALIAAGLDLARLIGGRRAASLAAGAAAAVWLLNKANHESAERRKASARYDS